MTPIYKRIILKITGEAFSSLEQALNIDISAAEKVADEIEKAHKLGIQIGVVIGGGNIVRGRDFQNINRATADYMGMAGTIINALFLQEILEKRDLAVRTQTAIEIKTFAEPYIPRRASRHMEKNRLVILACGTGLPYCSTDYTAMLRAYELNADAVLKGTKVDGLYTDDPKKKSAKIIPEISYQEAQKAGLKNIIDNSALGLVNDSPRKIPLHIFNIFKKGNLVSILLGKEIGSKIY